MVWYQPLLATMIGDAAPVVLHDTPLGSKSLFCRTENHLSLAPTFPVSVLIPVFEAQESTFESTFHLFAERATATDRCHPWFNDTTISYSVMTSEESSDDYSSASNIASTNDIENGGGSELERLKKECKAMVTLLKRLREEEEDLREKNVMLAREALLCGFQMDNLEAPPPKRRVTKTPVTRKEEK